MALIATQQMSAAGGAITYSGVSASDTADISNGRTFLHVKNAGASSDSCVLVTPGTIGPGLAISDLTVSVPNGQDRFIGPIDPAVFGTTGIVTVTHTYTTSVTCAFVSV